MRGKREQSGQRGAKGAKGSEVSKSSEGEQRGTKGSEACSIPGFRVSLPLWGQVVKGKGE